MDRLLTAADIALRSLFAPPRTARPYPARPSHGDAPETPAGADLLDARQKRLSGALMRVNHVGEVCAQALYTAQAATTRDPALRRHFEESAREETDHLAWTRQRLDELGSRPSLLNPLWYAGAFALGLVAGRIGDPVSLGFVAETERQVAAHLDSHLGRLPANDRASRAVVRQMKEDEERHADSAVAAGGVGLPGPVRTLMHAAGKVMTTTAHYV